MDPHEMTLLSLLAPANDAYRSGSAYVVHSRVSGGATGSGDGPDVPIDVSEESAGTTHGDVTDMCGDGYDVPSKVRELEARVAVQSEQYAALRAEYNDLKHVSDGRIAELTFDKDDVTMRAAVLTNKLAEANAKIDEVCKKARLAARAGFRSEKFHLKQAQVFFATLDGYELEVSELQGQVADLGQRNWQLLHPTKKRARHGEYSGDDYLPLSWS